MKKVRSKETTINVVLYLPYQSKDGRHPVRLKVTHNRQTKYFPVQHDGKKIFLSPEEWENIKSKKPDRDLKHLVKEIQDAPAHAREALRVTTQNNRPFSFEKFTKEYQSQESGKGFLALFNDHLETLKNENRIGTYSAYLNAYNAFKDFRKDRDLSPFDITVQVLKSFDAHLQRRGCGKTTTAIYMRAIKVVFNLAADVNPALLEVYPFARKQTDRNRYKIRSGSGRKGETLTIEQLQKFIALPTIPGLPDHEAKHLWLFSFYAQGMNMKDICLLKYQNIQGDTIKYIRAKTKDTEGKETELEVALTEPIRQIIRELGNPDKSPTSYVFTIIPNGLASTIRRRTDRQKTRDERIHEIIKQKTKMVNTRIQQLCKDSKDADLKDLELTTYWARHSFASLLKDAGESVEMIRELLGHSDIKTTESYLKRFDIDKKQAVNEKIQSLLKVS